MAIHLIMPQGSEVQSIEKLEEEIKDQSLEIELDPGKFMEGIQEIDEEMEEGADDLEMLLLEKDILFNSKSDLEIEEADYALDRCFEGLNRSFKVTGVLEDAKSSGEYSKLIKGMEEYYKLTTYCSEYLKLDVGPQPGLESIINTPFNVLEDGLESLGNVVVGLYKAVAGIIKWLLDMIDKFIKRLIRWFSLLKSKVKKLYKNFQEFKKNNPKLVLLSERNSESFINFLVKKYKGINRLCSEHVSKTPGVTGLGSTMVNLLEKEVNLLYPPIESLPLGKDTEFYRGLVGFYRSKDIINCKKAIKDSPEFAKMVAGAGEKIAVNNDSVICKIISIDYEYCHYLVLGGSDVTNFKPIIGKLKLEKVEVSVPDFKPEHANKIFNDKPMDWLNFALDYMLKNYKRIMKKPELMRGQINAIKSDLNKAYNKYKTNVSNKDVAACINMYISFCRKLVTKYQECVVKSCVTSYKQLFDVCKMLYSELIGSASIGKADAWDGRGQDIAKSVRERDLQGKDVGMVNKFKRIANAHDEGAKEGKKPGFFGKKRLDNYN